MTEQRSLLRVRIEQVEKFQALPRELRGKMELVDSLADEVQSLSHGLEWLKREVAIDVAKLDNLLNDINEGEEEEHGQTIEETLLQLWCVACRCRFEGYPTDDLPICQECEAEKYESSGT